MTISVVTIQWTLFGFSLAFGTSAFSALIGPRDSNNPPALFFCVAAPGTPGMGNLQWGGLKDVGITPDPLYAATIPFLLFAMYQLMFAAITPAIIRYGSEEVLRARNSPPTRLISVFLFGQRATAARSPSA